MMSVEPIYKSPNTSRQSSLSKFELCYDDSNDYQLNKPLSARLRRYDNNYLKPDNVSALSSPTNSATSPTSIKSAPFETTSNYHYNNTIDTDTNEYSDFEDFNPLELFKVDEIITPPPQSRKKIIRANSFPTNSSITTSTPPRKNSFLSNCKHTHPFGLRRNTIDLPYEKPKSLTIDTYFPKIDDVEAPLVEEMNDDHDCLRHHHRRGSVAIKFRDPQVITDNDINDYDN